MHTNSIESASCVSLSAIRASISSLMSYFNIHDSSYLVVFAVLPLLLFFSISEIVSWPHV